MVVREFVAVAKGETPLKVFLSQGSLPKDRDCCRTLPHLGYAWTRPVSELTLFVSAHVSRSATQ